MFEICDLFVMTYKTKKKNETQRKCLKRAIICSTNFAHDSCSLSLFQFRSVLPFKSRKASERLIDERFFQRTYYYSCNLCTIAIFKCKMPALYMKQCKTNLLLHIDGLDMETETLVNI